MIELAIAVALCAPPGLRDNPNPWIETKESDGLRVWTREVPSSSIREVKAEAVVNQPIARLWEVLADVPRYTEFMPYVVEARVLETVGATQALEYQLLDPPLVDKRDYALLVTVEHGEQLTVWRRSWTVAAGKGPPLRDGVIRLQVCDGTWTLEKLGSRSTRVEYYLYTDPGGSIPAWIANKANTTSVPALLDAVRQRARDPEWRP